MNMKRVGLGGLVVTLLCLGAARGEDMPAPYTGAGAPPPPPNGAVTDLTQPSSSWLVYPRCEGCCGPVGANGPIGYEVYLRNGFDFPLGGNPFGARMKMGWDVSAGARTLFFNPEQTAAWTADIGVRNVFNESSDQTSTHPLFNVFDSMTNTTTSEVDVAIRNLNRTYLDLSGGREWYLTGNANCIDQGPLWRVGFDVGGRYGTEKMEVTTFRHRTDVNAGVFLAVHTDVEISRGCCIFIAGLRSEYGYTWSDILQRQTDGDIQEISLLFNLGVRF
jgi:hypothetical protein